jgi:hypothetical protein
MSRLEVMSCHPPSVRRPEPVPSMVYGKRKVGGVTRDIVVDVICAPLILILGVWAYPPPWVYHQHAMFRAEQRAISAAADAYETGQAKKALSTDEPVHDDLEMACLSLWFSEQNLLYMQKNPTD